MPRPMSTHHAEPTPTHPLRAVDSSEPEALLEALQVALNGGDAVLPCGANTEVAAREVVAAHPAVAGDVALVIRTSGSTGTPKAVALSRSALLASARATHAALGGGGQWLVALSPEVVAGAQMLVRSLVSGEHPVFCTGQFSAERFLAAAKTLTAERRYTSLVPLQLARLVEFADGNGDGDADGDVAADSESAADARRVLSRFDAVLVGGQNAPEPLIDAARKLGMTIVRTYGSTETASGCVYEGRAVGDTELRIENGELWVAGSTLAEGYLDDAALTDERFVTVEGRRWFRTHDRAELRDGRLTVTGRLDNVFVSGGVKVSLDELERFIQNRDGWRSAVAVSFDDETWGQRAGVCVVGPAPDFAALQNDVRSTFAPAWVPVAVREMDELPSTASGKPDRVALAKLF